MRVYKVVKRKPNGVLVSAFASGELEVTYRHGEWAQSPIGGLLAFRDLDSVRAFLMDYGLCGCEVWEAEGDGELALPPMAATTPNTGWFATMLWDSPSCAQLCREWKGFTKPWPPGTVALQRLKLTAFLFRKERRQADANHAFDEAG